MHRLDEETILEKLVQLSTWKLDGKFISRRYSFASFQNALEFVNRVAAIAEEKNHHPFISIDYKVVTLRLTSWHTGGLTHLDFEEASAFNAVAEDMCK